MNIASCGHEYEDSEELYTLYQIYYDYTDSGEAKGVTNSRVCKRCCEEAVSEGYGYKTWEDVWDKLMEDA